MKHLNLAVLTAVICGVVFFQAGDAHAASRTWSGNTNANWNNAGNWDTLPVAGDKLIFPAGGLNPSTNNDFAANTAFSIQIDGTGYTLAGNAITVGGATGIVTSAGGNTISLGLVLSSNLTVDTAAGVTTISGDISETGGARNLTKSNTAVLVLSGNNSYSGTTLNIGGSLWAQSNNALGSVAGGTIVAFGTRLILSNDITVGAESLTISGTGTGGAGALENAGGNNSWAGSISFTSATSIGVDVGGETLTLSGAIDGAGGSDLTKIGLGNLTLSGNSTYDGATNVNVGTLWIKSSNALGSTVGGTTVAFGTRLIVDNGIAVGAEALTLNGTGTGGAGALENVSSNNSWAGAILLNTASSIGVDVAGDTLTLSGIISGAGGQDLTKVGSGALILSGANDYAGATTLSTGTLWIQNSTGLGTVGAGTTVAAGARLVLSNNIAVGAEALTLNGSGIAGSGALENLSGTNFWSGDISLASSSSIGTDPGSTLTLSGIISGAAGSNLSKEATGSLVLSGANTYDGNTIIFDGTVTIQSATAFGSIVGDTDVGGGASLIVTGGLAVGAEGLTLNGDGIAGAGALENLTGNNSWAGDIFIPSNTSIGSTTGTLTLDGIISDAGGVNLTKVGVGTVVLNGVNTYTGATAVTAGTLQVDGSLASPTTTVAAIGTLSGAGTVLAIAGSGNVAPAGTSAGTLSGTTGDFSTGGTLQIQIASNVSADKLDLSGNLTGGGTAKVTVDMTGYTPAMANATFSVAHSATALSGTFAPTVSNNTSGKAVMFGYGPKDVNVGVGTVPAFATIPGTSSIVRAETSPSNAATVSFTVTFSEAVSGVDATDFALVTTGAITGDSIASVSPAGPTNVYTVVVNTGQGDGTIQLKLVDDDTIINSGLVPLSGPGAGNGDFTTGETYDIVKNPSDRDGDGVSNALEILAGTNPDDPSDIPIVQAGGVSLDKVSVGLNFTAKGVVKDVMKVSVKLVVPTGFTSTGAKLGLVFAGAGRAVTLDAAGKNPKGSLVTAKVTAPKKGTTQSTITFGVKNDNLKAEVAAAGLTNTTTAKTGTRITVVIGVIIVTSDGKKNSYVGTADILYKSTTDKSGKVSKPKL